MVIDTQSVRAAAGVPKTTTGLDANKRTPGRRRGLAVDALMLHRRLAREYDHRPDSSASRVYRAATANMARRLTTPTPAWRDTLRAAA